VDKVAELVSGVPDYRMSAPCQARARTSNGALRAPPPSLSDRFPPSSKLTDSRYSVEGGVASGPQYIEEATSLPPRMAQVRCWGPKLVSRLPSLSSCYFTPPTGQLGLRT
jgi:hypothetical protein